jgi:lipopolysaccharide transport system permease protein
MHAEPGVAHIRPSGRLSSLGLREIWAYRDLLYFLARRDIVVRYKQAVAGIAWALIQPIVTMVIFSVIFGQFAKLPSEGLPYALFTLAALVPWTFFAAAIQRSGSSLVANASLITKVYFPRLMVPLSAVLGGLLDLAISLVLLAAVMAYYGVNPGLRALWLVPLTFLLIVLAFAVGAWLSALNAIYRDFQQVIPFMVTIWMWVSPIAYSSQVVPSGKWTILYQLNPIVGVVQGYRWALLDTPFPAESFVVWIGVTLAVLVSGLVYFAHVQNYYADVI